MVEYGFYNSSNGDRKYTAEQVSMIFDYLINDGVLETYGDKFFTTPSTSTLGVVLGSGWAWFNYTWTQSDTQILFNLSQADPSLDRIDTVYLQVDKRPLQRQNKLGLLEGSFGLNPKPATFPTTTDVYYHPLAYVRVRANATRISASDIEILVGKTNAPFITSILQTTDITQLFAGWSEQFGAKMTQWQAAYDTQMSTQQSGYTSKMTEWESEVDTLETNLTANVNATIKKGEDQIAAQAATFSTQLTNMENDFLSAQNQRRNTFNTSLQGWEADFEDWFTHLQTYLSEDVVTNLQLQIDQLKTSSSTMSSNISSLQGSVNTANTNISNLQSSMSTANTNISNLQSTMNTANSNISKLQGKTNAVSSSNIISGASTPEGIVTGLNVKSAIRTLIGYTIPMIFTSSVGPFTGYIRGVAISVGGGGGGKSISSSATGGGGGGGSGLVQFHTFPSISPYTAWDITITIGSGGSYDTNGGTTRLSLGSNNYESPGGGKGNSTMGGNGSGGGGAGGTQSVAYNGGYPSGIFGGNGGKGGNYADTPSSGGVGYFGASGGSSGSNSTYKGGNGGMGGFFINNSATDRIKMSVGGNGGNGGSAGGGGGGGGGGFGGKGGDGSAPKSGYAQSGYGYGAGGGGGCHSSYGGGGGGGGGFWVDYLFKHTSITIPSATTNGSGNSGVVILFFTPA